MSPSKSKSRTKPSNQREVVLAASEPIGALAVSLLRVVDTSPTKPLVFLCQTDRRAEMLARIIAQIAPRVRVALLPASDNLPYDRVPASRSVMGRRAGTLRWLTDHQSPPELLLTTAPAIIQRVPPQEIWAKAHLEFAIGDVLDLGGLEPRLRAVGYTFDDVVDEPGEVAIRERVIDLFPAAAPMPCRIEHEEGRITAIRSYDPLAQRSVVDAQVLVVDPATENLVLDDDGQQKKTDQAPPSLASNHDQLRTIFDYVPAVSIAMEEKASARVAAFFEQIADAYEARKALGASGRARTEAPPPAKLYMSEPEWRTELERRLVATAAESDAANRVPRFARERNSWRAFVEFVTRERERGARIVFCAGTEKQTERFARRAERELGEEVRRVSEWAGVIAAPRKALIAVPVPVDEGFVLAEEQVTVITAADVFGSRASGASSAPQAKASLPANDLEFRVGDALIHLDHGMGILEGLESIPSAAEQTGSEDALRLCYANDATLLVPIGEIGKLWRYGAEGSTVHLDKLKGDAWQKRRAEVEAEIEQAATALVQLATARKAITAPKLIPPRPEYERFVARFPFALTDDQRAAADAVLADLSSGKAMDRLVCGDVGFGKTEVALRAAAAAALSGKQVAIFAPTTVLVRQHVSTFRRRFAGLGIEIAHLSGLVKPAEARRVKKELSAGTIPIVIGTHALASKTVRFHDLGLVIVDEEQRFGQKQKAKIRGRKGVHVLTLTATPIPRTLQAAMVGLQDISIIATPPVLRQPIRTVLAPFDAATVRSALVREHKRGGQSFVVCPRIEDLSGLQAQLRELVHELDVLMVHGQLEPEKIDEIMVSFAEGDGDVLLATNIIESGLDVPSANTILIWRPDRFGLAQLHQLRGRVGRGARRGVAYLVTDPAVKLPRATEKRLRTLETLDRLGAGFAISARDLDLRGAGDLLGEEQAGHAKLIGLGLYQHLFAQALARAEGEEVDEWTPEVRVPTGGMSASEYVPQAEPRIDLYARLARVKSATEVFELRDETEDRFGSLPEPVSNLFSLAILKARCLELGIERLDAGARAFAATPHHPPPPELQAALENGQGPVTWKNGRFIRPNENEGGEVSADSALHFLDEIDRAVRTAETRLS